MFVPCDQTVRATGRVSALEAPRVELALTVHHGPHSGDIDRAYGSLATYVANHALAIEGPIREYYVIGPHETHDENRWRTESAGRSSTPAHKTRVRLTGVPRVRVRTVVDLEGDDAERLSRIAITRGEGAREAFVGF